jgi:hypothetical protein
MFGKLLKVIWLLCSIATAALIGNYKLYDSRGNALYDFSLSNMHAVFSLNGGLNPILTDRGQYIHSDNSITFPSNSYKSYSGNSEMSIVFWLCPTYYGTILTMTGTKSNNKVEIRIFLNSTYIQYIGPYVNTSKNFSVGLSNV